MTYHSASFKKGTINIGDRQQGRLQARSIINCEPKYASIKLAFEKIYSNEFQKQLRSVVNPYGEGGASEKIVSLIKTVSLDQIIKKKFYDFEPWKYI